MAAGGAGEGQQVAPGSAGGGVRSGPLWCQRVWPDPPVMYLCNRTLVGRKENIVTGHPELRIDVPFDFLD